MKLKPKPSPPVTTPTTERHEAYGKDLGGIVVRRALPAQGRRLVGPWCFLDHFGPADVPSMNVGPHPHIGLQTVTWLIEGEIHHKDSLGTDQVIRAGQLNWMTSGRGIVHAELGDRPTHMHGVQFWVALPEHARQIDPAFEHIAHPPTVAHGDVHVTVIAGTHAGQTCPATHHHPMVGLDAVVPQGASATLPLDPGFEHAALVIQGSVVVAGEPLEPGTLLYLGMGRDHVTVAGGGRLILVGGEPLREDVLLWWNFVARTHDDIVQARQDWLAGRLGSLTDAGPHLTVPELP